ncbi:MAG: glycosyltransferase family 2 protein [Candidatus Moraniibacteriota bacterium]
MLDIRIQIVNYKTKPYLLDCIASMREELESASFSYSFALLDNASGDDLSDIPKRFPWLKNLEIIQGTKNLGFGAGHNLLAKGADEKYLLILNPDIKFIEPDTIRRLLDEMKRSRSQIVGPRLITAEGKRQAWDHGGWHGTMCYFKSACGINESRSDAKMRRSIWVSGAVFLIERNCFDRVSGFDEQFFLYAEEIDLCDRVRKNKGVVMYVPDINVLHLGGVVANRNDWLFGSTMRLYKNRFLRLVKIVR